MRKKILFLLLINIVIIVIFTHFRTFKSVIIKSDIKTSNYLEIPKISFKKEIDLNNQNVDIGLWVSKESIFPDYNPSNVIIAGHSGNASNAYFKKLYLLNINDIIKLYYNNKLYEYQIFDIEKQKKTGTLDIKNMNDNIITLITCTKNNNSTQTIYYGQLKV